MDSWIQKIEAQGYRPLLSALFERYVDTTLDYCRRNFKSVVTLPAISQVQTVCKILEGFLPQVRMAPSPTKAPNTGLAIVHLQSYIWLGVTARQCQYT